MRKGEPFNMWSLARYARNIQGLMRAKVLLFLVYRVETRKWKDCNVWIMCKRLEQNYYIVRSCPAGNKWLARLCVRFPKKRWRDRVLCAHVLQLEWLRGSREKQSLCTKHAMQYCFRNFPINIKKVCNISAPTCER